MCLQHSLQMVAQGGFHYHACELQRRWRLLEERGLDPKLRCSTSLLLLFVSVSPAAAAAATVAGAVGVVAALHLNCWKRTTGRNVKKEYLVFLMALLAAHKI